MALYRFEAKVISRSGGRSTVNAAAYRTGKTATSAAAYRHCATLTDERTGATYDYSRKRGVAGSEILAPADAPEWATDRERLWNTVERVEKRQDAQLSRDFVISFPHELEPDQRHDLLTEFLTRNFVDKGYLCDVAYHRPHGKGDDRNHHAHVMVPMRKLDANGFSPRKERPQGNPFDAWKRELEELRKDWAATANRYLEAAGRPERVSHLSLEAQGIDRDPEPKQGAIACQMEREGRESHAGNDRRRVQAENAERASIAAQVSNVVSLAVEAIKRGHMDEPSEEMLQAQAQREAEALRVLAEQQKRADEFLQRAAADAEAAKEDEKERRKADERRAAFGDIASGEDRYAQALAQNYDIRDPYASLARAAMTEYGTFKRQQEDLRKEIAATKDPQEREALELRRRIEGFEYMAITSERLAGISAVIGGREDAPTAVLDRERAKAYQEMANRLREERAEKQAEREQQERGRREQEQAAARPREAAPTAARRAERDTGQPTERKGERTDRDSEMTDAKAARLARQEATGQGSGQQAARTTQRTGGRGGR